MILLLSTLDEKQAKCYERFLQNLYKVQAVYRFQYHGNDGLFHYDIMINPLWLSKDAISSVYGLMR